jgi:hypothetical protein
MENERPEIAQHIQEVNRAKITFQLLLPIRRPLGPKARSFGELAHVWAVPTATVLSRLVYRHRLSSTASLVAPTMYGSYVLRPIHASPTHTIPDFPIPDMNGPDTHLQMPNSKLKSVCHSRIIS